MATNKKTTLLYNLPTYKQKMVKKIIKKQYSFTHRLMKDLFTIEKKSVQIIFQSEEKCLVKKQIRQKNRLLIPEIHKIQNIDTRMRKPFPLIVIL